MTLPDLEYLAVSGSEIAIRATPKASRDRIEVIDGGIRVWVTAPADKGKANEAVRKLLAKSMGIAKTRLVLVRGETSREKRFRVA